MRKKIALIAVICFGALGLGSSVAAQQPLAYPYGYNPYAQNDRNDSLSPQCTPGTFWSCPLCAQTGYPGGCYCSCRPLPGYNPLNPPGSIHPNDPPSLQQWWYSTRQQPNTAYPAAAYQYPSQATYAYQTAPYLAPLPASAAGPLAQPDPAYEQYLAQWWYNIWR